MAQNYKYVINIYYFKLLECKVDYNIPVGCDQVKARLLQQVISSAAIIYN